MWIWPAVIFIFSCSVQMFSQVCCVVLLLLTPACVLFSDLQNSHQLHSSISQTAGASLLSILKLMPQQTLNHKQAGKIALFSQVSVFICLVLWLISPFRKSFINNSYTEFITDTSVTFMTVMRLMIIIKINETSSFIPLFSFFTEHVWTEHTKTQMLQVWRISSLWEDWNKLPLIWCFTRSFVFTLDLYDFTSCAHKSNWSDASGSLTPVAQLKQTKRAREREWRSTVET